MENHKKNPRKQIEKFSTVFAQLSLVLVLFITYVLMEYVIDEKKIMNPPDVIYDIEPTSSIEYVKEPKKQPEVAVNTPPKAKPLTEIIKGDPPKTVTAILTPTIAVSPRVFTPSSNNKGEKKKETPPKIDNTIYSFSSVTPLFKGCKNLSKEENKACFDKKMKRFVQKKFDPSIGEEIGLSSGNYKIFAQFIIDENGDVISVQVRAPHQKLEKDVLQMIQKLPKFTPGKMGDKNVKVRYLLPINFQVD